MPPTLRELLEAPERARSLPPEAMAEVLGELVLLLARLLVHASDTPGTAQATNREDLDPLMTVAEVAHVLNLRASRVYEIVGQRRLAAVRLGKHIRIRRLDLRDWIEGQRETVVDASFAPSLSSLSSMSRSSMKGRRKSR